MGSKRFKMTQSSMMMVQCRIDSFNAFLAVCQYFKFQNFLWGSMPADPPKTPMSAELARPIIPSLYFDGVENFRQLGKSLMKTRNNRGPSIDPCGTPQ